MRIEIGIICCEVRTVMFSTDSEQEAKQYYSDRICKGKMLRVWIDGKMLTIEEASRWASCKRTRNFKTLCQPPVKIQFRVIGGF